MFKEHISYIRPNDIVRKNEDLFIITTLKEFKYMCVRAYIYMYLYI